MQLDPRTCRLARLAKDARFDGRFFVGVTTTGIYCRPVCPARAPLEKNVRYFASAAAAAESGLRPCLRCRPETSPGTPAWNGTSATVARGLRLISAGALDGDGDVEALAASLGVTSRHLRRLFLEHVGATPITVALTRRVHFAKRLIDATSLPFSDVAAASGFGSVRRFNSEIRRTYARSPTQLRTALSRPPENGVRHHFHLAFRKPYDWEAMVGWLRGRSVPGVEHVTEDAYRRTFALDGARGELAVRLAPDGDALAVAIETPDARVLLPVVERLRRMFDLAASPALVGETLGRDPLLAPRVRRRPGLRVPGAWDGFELAVRAILGQQVSVRAATTLAARVAAEHGEAIGVGDLSRLAPTPERLASAKLERLGVIGARAEAIRRLARKVADGELRLDGTHASLDDVVGELCELPGVGAWTAHYVAMRGLGEPDAFPAGDLVLRRAVGARTTREVEARAEAWRPWRAQAAMHIWQGASDDVVEKPRGGRRAPVQRNRESRRPAAARR